MSNPTIIKPCVKCGAPVTLERPQTWVGLCRPCMNMHQNRQLLKGVGKNMSASQRNKGKAGELEAARLLQPIFPDARRRVVNHAGVENGADLECTGAFAVQVKRHKKPAAVSALYEVTAPGMPLLLTRGDRGEWLAVLKAADLVAILADVGIAYEGEGR